MKKIILGAAVLSLCFLTYVGHLLSVVRPGYIASRVPVKQTVEQKREMYEASLKLGALAGAVGHRKSESMFLTGAGVLGAECGVKPSETKDLAAKGVEVALALGNETGDYDTFFQLRFAHALLLKDLNEKESARAMVLETLSFANQKMPTSYWVGNFKRLEKFFTKI